MVTEEKGGDAPWKRGGLRITRGALSAIARDAERGYAADEEAVGYLSGPAEDPLLCDETTPMQNRANQLHAMDPEVYFRTARTYFAINEVKLDKAMTQGRAGGRPVKVLYHSHLDAGAYFSPTDAAVMSAGRAPETEGGSWEIGPGPAWDLAFLVTSVRASGVDDHKLFVWDPDKRAFVESAFQVVEG